MSKPRRIRPLRLGTEALLAETAAGIASRKRPPYFTVYRAADGWR